MLRKHALWVLFSLAGLLLTTGCPEDNNNGNNNTGQTCTFRKDCKAGERCNAGVCTTDTKSCETSNDCNFDEYCSNNLCQESACTDDAQCTGGAYICENNLCRQGCRMDEDCTGEGEVCNRLNVCEAGGCTPTSCSPFEECSNMTSPSKCIPSGDCDNDITCAVYANFVNDGNEYICGAGNECIIKPPCQGDNDCRTSEGEICEERADRNICRKGCRKDDQCAANEFCDLDQFRCIRGCASDDDCSAVDPNKDFTCVDLKCIEICEVRDDCVIAGQVCTGEPRVCQGCQTDNDCPATQECDFTKGSNDEERANPNVGLCVDLPPDCPDDGYGDNNALDRAHEITMFPFVTDGANIANPLFCQENRMQGEWFKIVANPGKIISVELTYNNMGANLDLELLDANGDRINSSIRPIPILDTGKEELRYGVNTGGTYYVRVTGSLTAKNIPYNLNIDVADPPPCRVDALEENDTAMTAAALMPGMPVDNLQVCSGVDAARTDRDFYKLDVAANQIVTVGVVAPPQFGELELVVTDSTGNPITPEPLDDQKVQFAVETAGSYIVEVAVANNVGNIDYSIEWTQRENACADMFEPNNDAMGATALTGAGTLTGLNLCTDEDWYVIDLLPLQTITINADYDPNASQGFIDLRLRGPSDASLIAEYDTREILPDGKFRQKIQYTAPRGGKFFIAVSLAQGLNVPYDLDVQIQDGPPCTEDPFEDNDNTATAYGIDAAQAATGADNALIGLRYCDLDNDYYKIDLAEGDVILWEIRHSVAQGDLDAEIIGPLDNMGQNGLVRATANGTMDDETITYTVPMGGAGTYALRVFGKDPARVDYRVLTYLNNQGPSDPDCPDPLENNDDRMNPSTVGAGSYDLLVCGQTPNGADDDWFTTCLQAGETLTVDLTLDHSRGNIDLYLYDDTGSSQFLDFSNSLTNNESVTYTTSRDQCLFYRVSTFTNVSSNVYKMDVTITPAPTCVDDANEDNDTAATATSVVAPGLYSKQAKCEDDEDWFTFTVEENQKAGVYINFDNKRADIDVEIYSDPSGAADFTGTTTGVGEEVNFTAPDDANTQPADPQTIYTYYVKVVTKTRARLNYDLLLYLDTDGNGTLEGPEDKLCPDAFENNDTRQAAKPFPIGTVNGLLSCWQGGLNNDRDYYTVFVPSGATITVDVSFLHADGNIQAELYRGTGGAAVARGISSDDNETLVATNMGTGETYTIHVYGGSQRYTNYYDLTVGLSFADMCAEDMIMASTKAGAQTITQGAYADLALCEGTEDWAAIDVTSGQDVFVGLEVNNLFGDVDVELYDETGTVVASAVGTNNVETFTHVATSTGTYHVRVFAKNAAFIRNFYDLYLQVGNTPPAQPFCPDPYERNDTPTSAVALNFGTQTQYTDMIACGADADWYAVNLAANNDYDMTVFFDQTPGQQLDIEVQNDAGTVVFSGTSTGNDEILSFKPTASGVYYVGVKNVAATPDEGNYYLVFDRSATACKEDDYEAPTAPNGNNTAATAKNLPAGDGLYALTSCSGANAEDYYIVTATQAGNLRITVYNNDTTLPLLVEALDFAGGRILFADTATANRKIIEKTGVAPNDRFRLYVGNGGGSDAYFIKVEQF